VHPLGFSESRTGDPGTLSLETIAADLRHQDALETMTLAYVVIDDDTPMAIVSTTALHDEMHVARVVVLQAYALNFVERKLITATVIELRRPR
jgi:hypothetical protein